MSVYPLLDDKEWLLEQTQLKKSISEIAKDAGCKSNGSVYQALRRHQIEYNPTFSEVQAARHMRERAEKWPQLLDRDWVFDRHQTKGMGLQQIANELGCSIRPIIWALEYHGIEAHGSGHNKKKDRPYLRKSEILQDAEWLRQQLSEKTLEAVAEENGYSVSRVWQMAHKHGIVVRTKQPSSKLKKNSIPELLDPAWLNEEYIVKDRKVKEIADALKCSHWTVIAALYRYRILKESDRPTSKKDPSLPTGVMRKDGYLIVFQPDHPNANGRGFVMQHRLICEATLGRYLTAQEEVHHLNERRDDNRIENLLVMPDYRTHMEFHRNPPAWVPRCECCGKPRPEILSGRPEGVPLEYRP